MSLLKVHVLDAKRVVAAGGPVGLASSGVLMETEDGGETWTQTTLKGHGYVFGVDFHEDQGFAVTCIPGGFGSSCGIWASSS